MKTSKLILGLYKILGKYPKTTKHIREITSENRHEGKAILSALKWLTYSCQNDSEDFRNNCVAVYQLEKKLMARRERRQLSGIKRQYTLSDFFREGLVRD